jgi:hypothetical protein
LSLSLSSTTSAPFIQYILIIISNTANNPQPLRLSLSEQYSSSNLQILRSIHKSEFYMSFVPSPHYIFIHFQYLSSLSYNPTMYHSLIIVLYSSSMVQYYYFSFKVIYYLWLCIFIN